MTATAEDAQVVFTDGFVLSQDIVLISSRLASLDEEEEQSRIFTFKSGEWFVFDVNLTVVSICVLSRPSRQAFCLGWDGRINVSGGGNVSEERIPDAGLGKNKFGYLRNMRVIRDKLYACGGSGQVYRREASGWVHLDRGVLQPGEPEKVDRLYCIHGTSESNIYAVGKRGVLWHYDGQSWNKLESPTVENLRWVTCVADDEVYICGENSTFFRGYGNKWTKFAVPRGAGDFWCVEHFAGRPYLASYAGLFDFDGKRVQKLDTGLIPAPDGHRLHANDGVLWSFGNDHLCFFDGKKWTYVKHPDNP